MKRLTLIAALVLLAACSPVANHPTPSLPARPTVPAGAVPADMLNPNVTPATIHSTICVRGWTATIRPPTSYTEPLKLHQIATYGFFAAGSAPGGFEEDHAIALETGGAPTAKANLWPESHAVSGGDDTVENATKADICAGRISLADGQLRLYRLKVAHGYSRAESVAP